MAGMCGRYASTRDPATLATEFDAVDGAADGAGETPEPDYNVAPTKPVLAVVDRHPRGEDGVPDPSRTVRSIRTMRWGLVPSWSKDDKGGARLINARSESAAEKPAFRTALRKRRCLLPADGWFEWQRQPGGPGKQPFFMTRADGSVLAMAGLWEIWRPPGASRDDMPLITATVLTTEAVGPLQEIHDRMPLVLPRSRWSAWLDPDVEETGDLLAPPGADLVAALELRPVSSAVNNVRNSGPDLVRRAEPDQPALLGLDEL